MKKEIGDREVQSVLIISLDTVHRCEVPSLAYQFRLVQVRMVMALLVALNLQAFPNHQQHSPTAQPLIIFQVRLPTTTNNLCLKKDIKTRAELAEFYKHTAGLLCVAFSLFVFAFDALRI